ncbi:hypothetical protein N7523_005697 [Penicillium sp. IBT 18751x]|nr:hypothetical protein N7523_005697 [Penicillium sp. IBT 18751x]
MAPHNLEDIVPQSASVRQWVERADETGWTSCFYPGVLKGSISRLVRDRTRRGAGLSVADQRRRHARPRPASATVAASIMSTGSRDADRVLRLSLPKTSC